MRTICYLIFGHFIQSQCMQQGNNLQGVQNLRNYDKENYGRNLLQSVDDSEYVLSINGCNPQFEDCQETPIAAVTQVAVEDDPWRPVVVVVREKEGSGCSDDPPENAPFDCKEYQQLGLCPGIPKEYCQQSCKACKEEDDDEQECVDILYPGIQTCGVVVERNLCKNPAVIGKYCLKSCGQCERSENNVASDDCSKATGLKCDQEGLLAFKNSIVEGSNTFFASWIGNDPCEWAFVTCELINAQNKRVSELSFLGQPIMTASLVPELSKLRYLKTFYVMTPILTGELIAEFSELDQLELLIFRTTKNIKGSLPKQYSTWKNIWFFEISNSELSGTIPKEYSAWEKIENFNISNNEISGEIPQEFSHLSELWITSFQMNQFSGNLPVDFSVLKNLQQFEIGTNLLTGQLPVQYSEWKQISIFAPIQNKISGTLPQQYSQFSNIYLFDVSQNNLQGSLPIQYSLWRECERFSVADIQFSGTLPIQYSKMKEIAELEFQQNQFSGDFPIQYSTMIDIYRFNSYQNQLPNQIPIQWSEIQEGADFQVS